MRDLSKLGIKPAHAPVHYGGSHIRIGGIVPGIRLDLVDRDGSIWQLVRLLNGSMTVDEIVAKMANVCPNTPEAVVRATIDDLDLAGHLEDAEEPDSGLDADARLRYSRSKALYQWMDLRPRRTSWDTQVRLGETAMVVIGLGGAGGAAALALVLSGVGYVHCVDRDSVELSNLNRHVLYLQEDIDAPKAQVAVPRLRSRNSTVEVTGEVLDVDSPEIVRDLASRFDVVLLAADEPEEIRTWVNRTCLATRTPWVHTGYHGPLVSVGLYRPGAGPCFDCRGAEERARLARMPARTPANRRAHAHAATAVSAALAGNLAAHAAISLVTEVPPLATNREYGFSLYTMTSNDLASLSSPSPRCPSCGTNG